MQDFHFTDRDDRRDTDDLVSLLEILTGLDAAEEGQEEETIPEAELVNAHERAFAVLTRPHPPAHGSEGPAPIAVLTIADQVEAWLAQAPLENVRERGESLTMPPIVVAATELTDYGYEPSAEIDADVDSTTGEAQITVVLRPVREEPTPLQVAITSSDGSTRSARVDEYGFAKVTGVPVTQTTPRDLTFTFVTPRKDQR
ncbi:hypothetical protein ABZ705_28215 [Streptomyces sp. NPDC006984]|uniref:hypothetical protein n=1 Tax=Streptomyces sp. NPDC006984 TaxID=3155463 RepID=UPI0033E83D46